MKMNTKILSVIGFLAMSVSAQAATTCGSIALMANAYKDLAGPAKALEACKHSFTTPLQQKEAIYFSMQTDLNGDLQTIGELANLRAEYIDIYVSARSDYWTTINGNLKANDLTVNVLDDIAQIELWSVTGEKPTRLHFNELRK